MKNSETWQKTFLHHDDIIKWKHFPRYWLFVRGIHRSPVTSPHKGQWRGALMYSLICVWIFNVFHQHRACWWLSTVRCKDIYNGNVRVPYTCMRRTASRNVKIPLFKFIQLEASALNYNYLKGYNLIHEFLIYCPWKILALYEVATNMIYEIKTFELLASYAIYITFDTQVHLAILC